MTFWEFPYPSRRAPVLADNVVATSQPLAAQAGIAMLARGGNAVDAAIATAAALTIVEPTSNGIGGDAFALVWSDGRLLGLNGSGRAPAAWSPERFAATPLMPDTGWESVTVPGGVDAWRRLAERFGRLPFAECFEPAIKYATDGFVVTPIVAEQWERAATRHGERADFRAAFLPGGRAPRAGERFRHPEAARTLTRIARTGGEELYRGELAAQIAAAAKREEGALTEADLASHRSEWVEPLAMPFGDAIVHELPPNGQGIAALVALGVLDRLALADHAPDDPEGIHLQIEAMKIGFAEAHRHVAEPAAMSIGPEALLDAGALERRAAAVDPGRAAEPAPTVAGDRGTVYLTTADRNGIMVSFIQSNFWGFGSGVVVPGTGIAMQNRGHGFSLEPGHPNRVGGGKRPYHTIIPGFVTRGGKPLMSFGVMGGHMQPQGHVQMCVRVLTQGQNPQAAADAPRWHVLEDGSVALETGPASTLGKSLAAKGHTIAPGLPPWGYGGAQLVLRLDEGYLAASDPRKDGSAAGY